MEMGIARLVSLEWEWEWVDLIFCYKIVFGIVDVPMDDFFSFSTFTLTRSQKFKLCKNGLSHKPDQTF